LQELPSGKEERPGGLRLPFGSGTGYTCDLFGLRPAYNSAFRASRRSPGLLPGLLPGAQRQRRWRRQFARTRPLVVWKLPDAHSRSWMGASDNFPQGHSGTIPQQRLTRLRSTLAYYGGRLPVVFSLRALRGDGFRDLRKGSHGESGCPFAFPVRARRRGCAAP